MNTTIPDPLPPPRVPYAPTPAVPLDRPAMIDFDPARIIEYIQRKHHVAVGLTWAARNLLAADPYSRSHGAAEAVARWEAEAADAEGQAAEFQSRLSQLGVQAIRYAGLFDPAGLAGVLAGLPVVRDTLARLDEIETRLDGIDGALVSLARSRKAGAW